MRRWLLLPLVVPLLLVAAVVMALAPKVNEE